jgi:phosphate-selective porin OprO/OprP
VTALPWYEEEGRCLLHLGADFSHRSGNRDVGQEPFRYRSFPGVRVGRYVFADTGNIPAESADLANAEFGLNLGAFSLQAEYCRVWVHDARLEGGVRSPTFSSWYVQASYFLTGEYRTYRRYVGQRTVGVFDRPRPSEDFFFVPLGEGGGWRDWGLGRGAWEVAVRYSSLDLDDPSQGVPAQTLRDVTFGLNWYLTFNTKVQWNYILADRDFESRGNRGMAHIFAMRFHHDF